MRFLLCIFLFALGLPVFAAGPVDLPTKEKFYLVLLIGQSNMAGRGKVTPVDRIPRPRVLMLDREGIWRPAVDPVHYDKKSAGVGPGRTFADLLAAADPEITVGLIPAACGGAPLTVWRPGVYYEGTKSHPYDDAVARAQNAMKSGTLKVILFHQGETDSGNPEMQAKYYENLMQLFASLRKDLHAEKTPIVVGQLGSWKPWNEKRKPVDAAQRRAVQNSQPAVFVTSEGLSCNSDQLHFNRDSQIEFGKRYYAAYVKLLKQISECK